MKYLILLVTILLSQFNLRSQGSVGNNNNTNNPLHASIALGTLNTDNFRTYNLEYNDVKGSPYLEKEFLSGYVILIDKSKTKEIKLQFDIYSNELFYMNEDDQELIIDQKTIREIVMKGKEESYHFKRINHKGSLVFYDILFESKSLQVYADLNINFYEGKDQGITKTDPRFSRSDKYYVLEKGNEPKRVKLKTRDLYKYFSQEDQKEMNKIIKEQKLKLKNSRDFKKLFLGLKN